MNTQKGFINILAVIIGLLVIGGGSYVFLNNNEEEIKIDDNQNIPPEVIENNQQQENIPTTNTQEGDSVDPSVSITSPNGGEIWGGDEEYTVSWSYNGLNSNDVINIGFRSDINSNMCWLESVNVGLGSFKIIPEDVKCGDGSVLEGNYKFQIIVDKYAEGIGVADMSDNYFTINNEQITEECINIKSISSNDNRIRPEFEIIGIVDNTSSSCNWGKFEGQAGVAQLYFNSDDQWKKVGQPAVVDITDENWMTEVSNFKINIGFNNSGIGLPDDQPIKVVLTEEDPRDGVGHDTFEIPLEL